MKRLLFIAGLLLCFCIYAQSQVTTKDVVKVATDITGATTCITGKIYYNETTLKNWERNVSGVCALITSGGTPGNVVGPASSVDSEIAIYSGTDGKVLKRASGTGIVKETAGVIGVAGASDLPSGIDAAKIADGTVSNAELQFINSVTSNVQTQIDSKQASLGFTPENSANKDAASGYAGLDVSALLKAAEFPAFTGDTTKPLGSLITTVVKVNGNTPGGTCTNQFARSIDSSGRPTCGSVVTADLPTTVVQTNQPNTYAAFAQIFQSGTQFILGDPNNTTKQAEFGLSNITAGQVRIVTIPDANSVTVQPDTGASSNFLTAISALGVISKARPSCSSLSDAGAGCSSAAGGVQSVFGRTGAVVAATNDYTPTQVGLGSVTNDVQTKAAVVPNTAPNAGQLPVGNAGGTAYAPASVSGDATLASTGALTLKNTGTAGTYRSTTYDAQGRETSGTNPTTFSGYGLSDTSANLRAALTDELGTGADLFDGATPTSFVCTNCSGTASGLTAGTATNSTNVAVTDDTTTNATMYPTWVTANTGNLPAKVSSTKMTFNPSNATLTLVHSSTIAEVVQSTGNAPASLRTLNPTNTGIFGVDDTGGDLVTGSASGAVMMVSTGSTQPIQFAPNSAVAATLTVAANLKIGGTASRGTTEGTNQLVLFNGTAPAGTLTNGASFFAATGEMKVADASGNITLLSPHDLATNEWVFDSKNTKSGKSLRIDMERMMKALNAKFGWDYVHEPDGSPSTFTPAMLPGDIGGCKVITPTPGATVTVTIDSTVPRAIASWTASEIETVNISGAPQDGAHLTFIITNDAGLGRVITLGTGLSALSVVTGVISKKSTVSFVAYNGTFYEVARTVGF